MKKLTLGLTLVITALLSAPSYSCQQEAQFIGKVKNWGEIQRSESTSECFYEIEYTMFNSSLVCPLDIDEVGGERFQDFDCNLKNGDQVSGYMSRVNDRIVLE